jgi:predicted RNA-binding Zn ribbon-like protein
MDPVAPSPALQLVLDFVNTNDVEAEHDELRTPDLLLGWMSEHGIPAKPAPTEDDRLRAVEAREALRALGGANNGEELPASLLNVLNRVAEDAPVIIGLQETGFALKPAGAGVDGLLAVVLAGVAGAMADDSWARVKTCRNHGCRWLFFDRSRNRSGTWCSMAVCGSRSKSRAYRSRRKVPSA